MIPIVHFQFMPDEGHLANELFNSDKPFLASIVPNLLDKNMKTEEGADIYGRIHPANNYYHDWAIEVFKENKDNHDVAWVQEGYRHCCGGCFNKFERNGGREENGWPDPWHEHICLDGSAQSLEKQIEIIGKGKKLMEEILGVTPIGYCPPNHLYNEDTLEAVKQNGFDYLLIRNGLDYFLPDRINLPAYKDKGLIILPETKLGFHTTPVVLTYYDHLVHGQWNGFLPVLDSSTSLSELEVHKKQRGKVRLNQQAIEFYKNIRDLSKRFKKPTKQSQ